MLRHAHRRRVSLSTAAMVCVLLVSACKKQEEAKPEATPAKPGETTQAVAPKEKALKVGLIAVGGLAGLTAGSAGISSLRHHREGARDDS